MNREKIKKKLSVLERPGFDEVLFDALKVYIQEARGEDADDLHIADMAGAIAFSLNNQYLRELPKKQPAVVNKDLEDLIKEIKDGQSND